MSWKERRFGSCCGAELARTGWGWGGPEVSQGFGSPGTGLWLWWKWGLSSLTWMLSNTRLALEHVLKNPSPSPSPASNVGFFSLVHQALPCLFSTRDPSPNRTLSQSSGMKEGQWLSLSHPVLSLHSGGNVAVISKDKLFLLRWVQTPSAARWGRGRRRSGFEE